MTKADGIRPGGRLAVNLSLVFTELPLCERFAAAAEFGFRGVELQFPYDVPAATLAAAAERAGVELPSSCRGGMCCTCRAMVAEGAVEMAVNYSLEAWEIEAGFVLACQARPTTPKVTLDFDAV